MTPTPSQTPTATETPLPAGGPINVNADCSIYDAVQSANDDSNAHNGRCVRGQGDDTIILPTGGGTTTLTSTLDISSNITITGNGHTLSGGNRVRVIRTTANLTIDKLTIRDGRTTGTDDGAGIELQGQSPSRPSLTVTNSAFIHNIGTNSGGTTGGAIFTKGAGQVRISNSTFSGNSSTGGGALGFQNNTRTATTSQVILLHVTISDTIVHGRSNAVVQFYDSQRGAIRNSIIANTVDDRSACSASQGGMQIVSSLFEGGNDCGGSPRDVDPALGALTGSPAYYPLTSSSLALGGGNPNQCTATDQRGIMRPQPEGTRCDIGAYEDTLLLMPTATSTPLPSSTPTPSQTPTPSPTPTLTPLPAGGPIDVNADCPIHDAVKSANDDSNAHNGRCVRGQGDDTINLPAGETSTLASTLNISSNITINGNAHIIDGNNAVRPFLVRANFTLRNVTVQRGRTPSGGNGGAIDMNGRHTLIVENSSLRNNQTVGNFGLGGAIHADDSQAITIRNSTITGNRAYHGGAIYLDNDRDNRATLTHVTVVNNNSHGPGSGAVHAIGAQRMRFENSILANSSGGNCEESPLHSVELVNTLITVGSRCPATTLTADPALGALTGSPAYYPLLDSSPAIGAGNSSHCTASDQIGNSRPDPAGSNCDIGAIESARSMPVATPTPSLTPAETLTPSLTPLPATETPLPTATNRPANVTLNGTACHIVDAVAAANTSAATGACPAGIDGADTITLTENITLSATLTISSDLIINGAGYFLSGSNAVRVIETTADLTLNNITIKDGNVSGIAAYGGGIRLVDSATVNPAGLTITNSAFTNNRSQRVSDAGGAVYVDANGPVSIRNSTFANNQAGSGGAIFVENPTTSAQAVELIHVTISNNTTTPNLTINGALHVNGSRSLIIRNSIIANNGGRNCASQRATLTNTLIEGTSNCGTATLSSDPALGALTGNPAYFPLLANSPALEAGDSTTCASLTTDQIGGTRPQPAGTTCDLGAVESALRAPTPTPTPSLTPTETLTPSLTPSMTPSLTPSLTPTNRPVNVTLNGTACNIVDAVAAANTNTATGACPAGNANSSTDTITLTENITLSATLNISSRITIDGNRFYLDGNDTVRHFDLDAAIFTLRNITLQNGNSGGAFENGGAINLALASTASTLIIDRSAFQNNNGRSGRGGAINLDGPTRFSVTNSTFTGNRAAHGGAISFNSSSVGADLTHLTVVGNSSLSNTSGGISVSGAGTFFRTQQHLRPQSRQLPRFCRSG